MRDLPALGPRGEGWFLGQLVLFAAVAFAGAAGSGAWGGQVRVASAGAGCLLALAGGVLALRGILDLRENLTPLPAPLARGRLIDTGAYAIVRHPIYAGIILGAFGWGLTLASLPALAAAVALALFFDLKSRREEVWLAAKYPDYDEYRCRTRKLVPGLY
jgi:protein-S-isoprenylcysteine O-methyltransferase Ste14